MTDLKARNWRELIKPKSIQIGEDSRTNFYGKFVAEPLERGFGITIGNVSGLNRLISCNNPNNVSFTKLRSSEF